VRPVGEEPTNKVNSGSRWSRWRNRVRAVWSVVLSHKFSDIIQPGRSRSVSPASLHATHHVEQIKTLPKYVWFPRAYNRISCSRRELKREPTNDLTSHPGGIAIHRKAVMVSISPRMRDSLDYENPDATDPRMEWGFRSLTLSSSGYEDHDLIDDRRPFSASPEPSSSRRRRRQRHNDADLDYVQPFEYETVADGDLFRLAVLSPGVGTQLIEIELIWETSKAPRRDYKCLSYCWQTTVQDAAILVNGRRFEVTNNLVSALRNIRKRKAKTLIWIDQICINQEDFVERGHQVSIMKHIYSRARTVVVCHIVQVSDWGAVTDAACRSGLESSTAVISSASMHGR
jgi:hypothetical protein